MGVRKVSALDLGRDGLVLSENAVPIPAWQDSGGGLHKTEKAAEDRDRILVFNLLSQVIAGEESGSKVGAVRSVLEKIRERCVGSHADLVRDFANHLLLGMLDGK